MKLTNLKTNFLSVLLGGAMLCGMSTNASALGTVGWNYQLDDTSPYFYDLNDGVWDWVFVYNNDIWTATVGDEEDDIVIFSQGTGRQGVDEDLLYIIDVSDSVFDFDFIYLEFSDLADPVPYSDEYQAGTFTYTEWTDEGPGEDFTGEFYMFKGDPQASILLLKSFEEVYLARFVFIYDDNSGDSGEVEMYVSDDGIVYDVLTVPFSEDDDEE